MAKAIIELIMNSVDAGAGAVFLDITPEGFTCRDDGRGFATHDDVKRYFGRFGTPIKYAQCAHNLCLTEVQSSPIYRDVGHLNDYAAHIFGEEYLRLRGNPFTYKD